MATQPFSLPPGSDPLGSTAPTRTSGLAVASLVLGVLSCPFTLLASIPGLICGILGLRQISRSEREGTVPRLTGRGMAITGVVLSGLITVVTPLLVLLLLPATWSAANAARSAVLLPNLKQVSLASAMARDKAGLFLGDIVNREPKALLSWRVAILPYLEEEDLYKQFHLDEPWDSEHNKKLLSRMPAVFATPGKPRELGLTDIVHPVAVGTAFGEVDDVAGLDGQENVGLSGVRPESIRDGLGNTIFVINVPGIEIPWTQPVDFKGDPVKLFEKLRRDGVATVVVGTGDGAVRLSATSLDPQVVQALFTRAGGERIPADGW
jgi:hypothetical protein